MIIKTLKNIKIISVSNGTKAEINNSGKWDFVRKTVRYFINDKKQILDTQTMFIKEVIY